MSFDSDLRSLSLVGGIARHLCEHVGYSQQDTYNIELCLVEAVTNSIRHGYGEEPGHPVDLTMGQDGDDFFVRIEDHGVPLREERVVEAQERARSDDALLQEGGRGLFIMESLMDSVVFRHVDGCNRVELRKAIPRAAAEPESEER